jgi:hypothetical protein
MTEHQRLVLAIAAVSLVLGSIFMVPWRLELTGDLQWGPVYRPPISYVPTYEVGVGSDLVYREARIASGPLALQLLAIVFSGAVAYWLTGALADRSDERTFQSDASEE